MLAGGVIAVALLVSGCSAVPAVMPHPSSRSSTGDVRSPPSGHAQALLLVPVVWRVRAAAGESAHTWIRFDSQIDLIRPKGDAYLSWSTQGDALLTHVEGWSMTLGSKPPKVPWLTDSTRFTRVGDGWVLTDASGHETARLVRDGLPPASEQTTHTAPEVNRIIRQQHEDAIAGPAVRRVAPSAATGTWGLPGVASRDGSVTLARDGTWTATTSCRVLGTAEGGGGAYRLLPSGLFLATEAAVAGTGCTAPEHAIPENATAVLQFWKTGSLAITGSQMIVYDRAGRRLGTLERKS